MVCFPNEGLRESRPVVFSTIMLAYAGNKEKIERRNSPLEFYYMTYIGKTKQTYNLRGL